SVPGTVLVAGWFIGRLGLATGVMSAAIPAGQSIFVPLATALIPVLGWRATYVVLGALVAVIGVPLLAWLVHEPPKRIEAGVEQARRPGLDIWLVGVGYFACGFSDQFVSLHFVALASDQGVPALLAAGLLSALLVFGIVGSVASGPLADRIHAKYMLAGLYFTRALTAPLLLFASAGWPLAVFAVVFGLTYIANQAPGARLARDRYGIRAVGPLMGGIGLAHQVGGSIGVALGGYSVVELGGYGPAIAVVAVVILVGALLQFAIPSRSLLPAS
ncbi:MAG: MFS transporter, partial [Chloroflexi bacterium]|nr:MFS transporter [Chloroflexota bacterium]